MNLKNLTLSILALLILVGGFLGYSYYSKIYKPNTVKDGCLFIPTNASFEEVQDLVRPFLKRVKPFVWVAKKKNYSNSIKPGKYKIKKGLNNNDFINLLRSGKQEPVKITFNNQDSFEKLAGRISKQIEADSISLLNAFQDSKFYSNHNFNSKTALGMYIPNTYEVYWNTNANKFRGKMLKEFNRFWNDSRIKKAKAAGLSKNEVITLASIVQKETSNIKERPMVAKLYLNRLNDGWPLQADPTIIFALKKKKGQNFEVKRVLKKYLKVISPYNTYKNAGLPPGLIAMPDISSIDAVLNPANHTYYYMCASVTKIGIHEFAKSLAQHNRNAAKYQNWLNKQGVLR